MLDLNNCCIVCCWDINKPKYNRQPVSSGTYSLVDLAHLFCKYFNCSKEYFFGTNELDFSVQKFPFCQDCKLLLIRISQHETRIQAIKREIEAVVRQITARCLSCQKKNCISCKTRIRRNPVDLIECSSLEDSETSERSSSGAIGVSNNLRAKIEEEFLPQLRVKNEDLEALAVKQGLRILEPIQVAPNVFVPAVDLFPENDNSDQGEAGHPKTDLDTDERLVNPRENASSCCSNIVVHTDSCLDHETEQDKEQRVGSELGGQNRSNEQEIEGLKPVSMRSREIRKPVKYSDNVFLTNCARTSKKSAGETKRKASSGICNLEPAKLFAQRKSVITKNLEHEKPLQFSNQYKFLELESKVGKNMRHSSQVVDENTMLLENQWPFCFTEGKGYLCYVCDKTLTGAAEFVDHCKSDHSDYSYDALRWNSPLWEQFMSYRIRLRNRIDEILASQNGSDKLSPICMRVLFLSSNMAKIFDLKTKPVGNNSFLYDGKHKFSVSETLFNCEDCDFQHQYKSVLIHHIFETHVVDGSPGKFLPTNQSYLEEVAPNKYQYRNLPVDKEGDDFVCRSCNTYRSANRKLILRHLYRFHCTRDRFVCTVCNKNCRTNRRYLDHMKQHQGEDPTSVQKARRRLLMVETGPNQFQYGSFSASFDGAVYKCNNCEYSTAKKQSLKLHLYRRHELVRKYDADGGHPTKEKICEYCGKVFKSRYGKYQYFKTHIERHLAKLAPGSFVCEVCGKSCCSKFQLQSHYRSIHMEKKAECKECGKKFRNPHCLRVHQLRHQDEKHYFCSDCNVGFKFITSYRRHLKAHGGERPFACDICGKTYTQSYDVVKHKKTQHPTC